MLGEPRPMGVDIPDPYGDSIDPRLFHIADSIAQQSRTATDANAILNAAESGIGPDQLAEYRDTMQMYKTASEMAQKTAALSDDEFNDIMNRMDAMPREDYPIAVRSAVDPMDAIAAGLGMMLDRDHAAKYAAIPLALRDNRDAVNFENAQIAWKNREAARQERLASMGRRAENAKDRRDTALAKFYGMTSEAGDLTSSLLKERGATERVTIAQAGLNSRAQMRDPAKVALYKKWSETPEGRVRLAELISINDPDAIEASKQLTPDEQKKMADKALVDAKTETENAMRDPRVEKVKAEVQGILTRTFKDNELGKLYQKRVESYPVEFQARMANVYSQIEHRRQTGKVGGKDPKYYGEGLEATLKQMKAIAEKTASDAFAGKNGVTEEQRTKAFEDYQYAVTELDKIARAKADYAKGKLGGTQRRANPRPSIDKSGGAKALRGGGKTRSGVEFSFEPD